MSTDKPAPERRLRILAEYQILTDAKGKEHKHPRGTVLPASAWATSARNLATMIRVGDLEVVKDDGPPAGGTDGPARIPPPTPPAVLAPPDTGWPDVGEGDV